MGKNADTSRSDVPPANQPQLYSTLLHQISCIRGRMQMYPSIIIKKDLIVYVDCNVCCCCYRFILLFFMCNCRYTTTDAQEQQQKYTVTTALLHFSVQELILCRDTVHMLLLFMLLFFMCNCGYTTTHTQ